jgi:hypothetical protein
MFSALALGVNPLRVALDKRLKPAKPDTTFMPVGDNQDGAVPWRLSCSD